MRRRRDRFLQRKRNLVNALVKEKLWPNDPEMRFAFSGWDPYALRSKALSEELSPEELGRVLLHLCQRRGFKSNRKEMSKDDEKGVNKQRIKALEEELRKTGSETLGAYMNGRKRSGVRFRENSELYAERRQYLEEFRLIKRYQGSCFKKLDWNRIENILFYQRPLKAQNKGKCRYYSDQDRAHKALPSTHRFRILQELSNLRMIGPHGESIGLSREERDRIYEILETQKTLGFNSLRQKLGTDCRFNLEDGKRDKLLGNDTSYLLRKPEFFGDLWDSLDDEKQDEIVYRIMEAEEDEDLEQYLMRYPLEESQRENLLGLTFPTGIARYSAILHRECVRIMKKNYCGYSDALESMGLDHRAPEGTGTEEKLPYYGEAVAESCIVRNDPNQNEDEKKFGKIGNPTVHIALNQLLFSGNPIASFFVLTPTTPIKCSRAASSISIVIFMVYLYGYTTHT